MAWAANSRFRLVILLGTVAGVGLLILFRPWQYGLYPVCPIHRWTGLLCPGCGGTRAIGALLRGQWAQAWQWNQLLVAGLPLAIAYGVIVAVRGRWVQLPRGIWFAVSLAAAAFTVWRNIG